MSTEEVQARIQKLYQANATIHLNAVFTEPRITVKNEPAIIKGVFPHLFQVKELHTGVKHIFTYADVLTKQVEIPELFGQH